MSGDGAEPGGDGAEDGNRPSLAEQRDVNEVYQPAEDSRLLAEAAADRVSPGERALDVGTGSGYVAAQLSAAGAEVVAADLNPHACQQASEAGLAVVRTDLASGFRDGAFDLVAFNPPYLPTDPDNEWGDWMERALSGGESGRAVIDPFLADVGRVLAAEGRAYLLVSTLTDVEAVRDGARAAGLRAEAVAAESYPFERLVVLELTVP